MREETVGYTDCRGREKNHVFSLGHGNLAMSIRHSCFDMDLAARCMNLEFREVEAKNKFETC